MTVNTRDGRPFEVFAHIGHSGYTAMADTEAICRLISMGLRSGISAGDIVKQLRGIGGSSQIYANGAKVFSIPDAIAQVLHRHFGCDAAATGETAEGAEICPECSAAMIFDAGCFSCQSCGYSTC